MGYHIRVLTGAYAARLAVLCAALIFTALLPYQGPQAAGAASAFDPALPPPGRAGEKPERIVSLNLCIDQILLRIAEPDHIAALTNISQDPSFSLHAARAKQYSTHRGLAEQIIAFEPDLVLAGTHTLRQTKAALDLAGIPVIEAGATVESLSETRTLIRTVAAAIGEDERGEALIRAIDKQIGQLTREARDIPWPKPYVTAALYQPGGLTSGKDMLPAQVMTRLGLVNQSEQRGLAGVRYLPLEAIVSDPPDILLVDDRRGKIGGVGYELLLHPALMKAVPAARQIPIARSFWMCGGEGTVITAQYLVERLMAVARDWR